MVEGRARRCPSNVNIGWFFIAFKDLEYGVECKFGKFGEESIVYPNMICAVADILARYW